MGRYRDARCRLCRREGEKLFLKGARCYTEKCAFERRNYPPGEHGKNRRIKETSYGMQLREKQKTRRIYGVMERQFRNYFEEASRRSGVTGETLLQLLETRLDNLVYRLGFATSRSAARQLVTHRHIAVNERVVTLPSYGVRAGDVISVREKSKGLGVIQGSLESRGGVELPEWLERNEKAMTGRLLMVPLRDSIPTPVSEQLIVELYSK
jgi:small subunit ribosomal protein S4